MPKILNVVGIERHPAIIQVLVQRSRWVPEFRKYQRGGVPGQPAHQDKPKTATHEAVSVLLRAAQVSKPLRCGQVETQLYRAVVEANAGFQLNPGDSFEWSSEAEIWVAPLPGKTSGYVQACEFFSAFGGPAGA